MCHSRKLYHKINRLYEKCVRIIHNDRTSSYEELLFKDYFFLLLFLSIHHKNMQELVIEIYKVAIGLCPEFMIEVFQFQIQNHSNLRKNFTFRISSFNTIFKGEESVSYLGPKIWSQVPEEIKFLESLISFKKASSSSISLRLTLISILLNE